MTCSTFRYEAREASGTKVEGVIEAVDRQGALALLSERGLFPLCLEACKARADGPAARADSGAKTASRRPTGGRISRKEISAFTREMSTLLQATIPIPVALQGLGDEEENPALRRLILNLASSVRTGSALSASMEAYPRLFPTLYTSMIKAGEEAGALDKVMGDLADLLEHEDEIRGEVLGAVAYPAFVLTLGIITTFVLLVFVLPPIFGMLEGTVTVLPLPTRVLLEGSRFFRERWPWVLGAAVVAVLLAGWFFRSRTGAFLWDSFKLRLPVVGSVFRASALGRFARTLGTLAHSGVSILPSLEIARKTVGNLFFAEAVLQVAEETRGGDSLATPLKKLGLFPSTMVQMIAVGEETGRLDSMLLRVATMQERILRSRSRTLISLLAPVLILIVGAMVGFIVIALLLPIFQMSQAVR